MKKQLLWGMLLLMAGFSSCQKDSFKPVNDESSTGKKTKVNVAQPTYYYSDLVLQPRQPGETFDTYKCVFATTEVKVMGTPSWNQAAYPTTVNGIPALGASYEVYTNANLIIASTAAGQDFFSLSIFGISGLEWGKKFRDALNLYQYAVSNYTPSSGAPYPDPDTFLGSSLTNQAGTYTVIGKLIRVTTGSHWALASVNYPTPTPVTQAAPLFVGTIQISVNGSLVNYDLFGKNGKITGISPWTPATVSTPIANGTYTTTSSSVVYNVDVTVTLPNGGGQVHYVGTADAS